MTTTAADSGGKDAATEADHEGGSGSETVLATLDTVADEGSSGEMATAGDAAIEVDHEGGGGSEIAVAVPETQVDAVASSGKMTTVGDTPRRVAPGLL